jgi:hypothetical protein
MPCVADDRPASQFPTADDIRRWQRALNAVADRVRTERGVVEPVRIEAGGASRYAYFGDLLIPLGSADGVTDELRLFEEIDWWVAFEWRGDPPPQVLDRDHEAIAQWRSRLLAAQPLWQQAAELVFADVARTTSQRWEWRVTIRDTAPEWPAPNAAELGTGIRVTQARPPARRPQRRLQLPELRLVGNGWDQGLPDDPANLAEAIVHLADVAQDRIIEETHRLWPRCPHHDHPLSIAPANGPAWICPTRRDVVAPVGELTTTG